MKALMFDENEIPERRCRSVLDGSGRGVSARAFILLENRPRNILLKYRGVGLARIRQKWGGKAHGAKPYHKCETCHAVKRHAPNSCFYVPSVLAS